jgi:hypothetical protein
MSPTRILRPRTRESHLIAIAAPLGLAGISRITTAENLINTAQRSALDGIVNTNFQCGKYNWIMRFTMRRLLEAAK